MLISKSDKKKFRNSGRHKKKVRGEEPIIDSEEPIQEDPYDEGKKIYSYDECTPEVFDTLHDK